MDNNTLHRIEACGIIAVLEFKDVRDAVPTVSALLDGGVSAIELALRTPDALAAMKEISSNFPGLLIGAGTVIRADQVEAVIKAGAHFGVAPGFSPTVVGAAIQHDFPFAPGITTASELEAAVSLGCRVLKLFPAEQIGGIRYLNAISGPYSYMGLKFIPLGGITIDNLPSWAECSKVAAVGGSWIARQELIVNRDYRQISKNASEAMRLWNSIRNKE